MENPTLTQSIVFYQNNSAVTSSRLVASKFNKRHSDVIRSIKNLEIPQDFQERNFALSHYEQTLPTGGIKQVEEYIMTKDGFVLLVMGFTGKEAMKFKIEYINAFNQMQESLGYTSTALTISNELREIINNAIAVVGSLNKLSGMIGVSPATISLLRKQGIMPDAKYKQSEAMISKIQLICDRIQNGPLGYDPELMECLLTVTNKSARIALMNLLKQKAVI